MKTTILKMILPVAAFALASAGAIGTANQSKDAVASLAGYRITGNPLQPCEFVKMCSDVPTTFCTVDGNPLSQQIWHQPSAGTPCNIAVYEP